MSIDVLGPGALDYLPCRYGASKLLFRGPRRPLDQPYAAFIGGTETYGKFIKEPFPALVENKLGLTCVNFGFLNAGIDAFVHDPFVTTATTKAKFTVVQVMGAQNMSNRFYYVHPRRNDRFVGASELLKTVFREIDFSEYNFNKHMLGDLRTVSPDRFDMVRVELQQAWKARMRTLLERIPGKIILLWIADHTPEETPPGDNEAIGKDPLFITREMINQIAPLVTQVVEVKASRAAIENGTEGMVFSEMEAIVAQQMLGPKAHEEAASALVTAINEVNAI